jgi:hypothetical protein
MNQLPTFRELAELRLAELGPRDKNISIKIARYTATMMIESEAGLVADLLVALEAVLKLEADSRQFDHGVNPANHKAWYNEFYEAKKRARIAIAKAKGEPTQ